MRNKTRGIIIALILLAGAGFFLRLALKNTQTKTQNPNSNGSNQNVATTTSKTPTTPPSNQASTSNPQITISVPDTILQNVPFTSQAPFGQWSDPVYQNACEEAVVLMADLWIKGTKSISATDATTEIGLLSAFEEKSFNTFYDLSTPDTAKLMQLYYNYDKIQVKNNIVVKDITDELQKGNLVIVPMNGQILGNPYYTAPGPAEHKILIKGYDFKTKEFITNDPGTRHGESYRYPEDVFFNAIREYPTGYKEPIISIQKIMMVVSK